MGCLRGCCLDFGACVSVVPVSDFFGETTTAPELVPHPSIINHTEMDLPRMVDVLSSWFSGEPQGRNNKVLTFEQRIGNHALSIPDFARPHVFVSCQIRCPWLTPFGGEFGASIPTDSDPVFGTSLFLKNILNPNLSPITIP